MRKRIILSVLFSVMIEIILFNFSALEAYLDKVTPLVLSIDQFTYLNWEETNGQMVSLPDPIIYVEGIEVRIDTMVLELDAQPMPQTCTIFYTVRDEDSFSADYMFTAPVDEQTGQAQISFPATDTVYDLRIDVGEEAGTYLNNISVHINEYDWDVSPARIIAMLVIYWGATGLMKLQKSPDYGLVEFQKGEDQDEA
ncbi:hypothetical protein [Intestinimonas butyriciproducens]|uniref:hypothetical protein n=1 Tax=Intestinimonas butyriciproducens TaxID=1297617 RepID=UPI00195722D3|nr:hypothetical protein [Intestinimonas butyriciproducens]MBM6974895.1 hypothetical protein [Intestinimonas butyriciproducens]